MPSASPVRLRSEPSFSGSQRSSALASRGLVESRPRFRPIEAGPDDVFIASWAKSGTTLMQQLFEADLNARVYGEFSRIHQFALAYLFTPSTDLYSCPLAMTDGAARTLLDSGGPEQIDRAVPRLLSRDPAQFWTSGQWMTEATGGSDVGGTETVARPTDDGREWRLSGLKWFTSAASSQIALALARTDGAAAGSRGRWPAG